MVLLFNGYVFDCKIRKVFGIMAYGLIFFCPFLLKEKDQKFKADINGPTH